MQVNSSDFQFHDTGELVYNGKNLPTGYTFKYSINNDKQLQPKLSWPLKKGDVLHVKVVPTDGTAYNPLLIIQLI